MAIALAHVVTVSRATIKGIRFTPVGGICIGITITLQATCNASIPVKANFETFFHHNIDDAFAIATVFGWWVG
ncbi:hypothetical protein D3C86_204640 [compost metagenome]